MGALSGIPLSYYFQSDIIKNYGGNSGVFHYMSNFFRIVDDHDKFIGNPRDILLNVLLNVIVFAAAGSVVGYFMNKKEAR